MDMEKPIETKVNIITPTTKLTKEQKKAIRGFEKKLKKVFMTSKSQNSKMKIRSERLQVNLHVVYGFQKNGDEVTKFKITGSNMMNGTSYFKNMSNTVIFTNIMPDKLKQLEPQIRRMVESGGKVSRPEIF